VPQFSINKADGFTEGLGWPAIVAPLAKRYQDRDITRIKTVLAWKSEVAVLDLLAAIAKNIEFHKNGMY
jgi:hypothetical protein